ncbi:putative 50S ribosome-binding GTPase [Lyophyllum shimeji]|uniref:50S ribosome-binding GTPase n=1 Tax=Lyophyllum shimeji TaxID=47721 RepID=A0A9P3PQE3_LYOSH|nr:putative 50S ribosome-binding GTPase [Lyophyllum shimeji]
MRKRFSANKGKRSVGRWPDAPVQNATMADIVIPVMGPTGAGKSTFINILFGESLMDVGHGLTSCTTQLKYGVIDLATVPGYRHLGLQGRLVVVDTPGFDDTYDGDVDILRRIADWLEKSYRDSMVLAGVIYLHDVSQTRFSGTARRNLEMFRHICGDRALQKVILGTTKWGRVDMGECRSHEEELTNAHWKGMIEKGSQVRRFDRTQQSAQEFVRTILANHAAIHLLQITEEMALERKIIPETKAGKELRYTLRQVLEMQQKMVGLEAAMEADGDPDAEAKIEELRQRINTLTREIQELKVPWARRLARIFSFG